MVSIDSRSRRWPNGTQRVPPRWRGNELPLGCLAVADQASTLVAARYLVDGNVRPWGFDRPTQVDPRRPTFDRRLDYGCDCDRILAEDVLSVKNLAREQSLVDKKMFKGIWISLGTSVFAV